MPQVNATELYISLKQLAEADTEEVQQTTTSLQFTALDDGCITMGGYTMESYIKDALNKRQLLRYLGIGRSLTKCCESCCWHTWIRIRVSSTTITPYLGT